MKFDSYKHQLKNIINSALAEVDIQINGDRPWDIKVLNENLYQRVIGQGSLGLGEAYVEGWWDCQQLDELFNKILKGRLQDHIGTNNLGSWFIIVSTKLRNLQNLSRSFQVGEQHYDLGNDLYQAMLDTRLNYSCGYWREADNLEAAQEAKLNLICQKLQLKPGMTMLDIGCGWGGLMKYAAQNYGVSCVGITISQQQLQLGQQLCNGLPIKFLLQDYRKLQGKFDRVVSVGMFEHVGYKNYRQFMEVVEGCLEEEGLFLLHTIGNRYSVTYGERWSSKYIFPNGMLPSLNQIFRATEKLFVTEDLHNFGSDYDLTLMAWLEKFEQHWPQLKSKYRAQFYRHWKYYLCMMAGSFRSRNIQLWQIVFAKQGMVGGYGSIR
ncbi:MAG: cyclopropane fatty acyl phospholipid synthase [Cyanobacteria bacterium P01_F01_bin.143]